MDLSGLIFVVLALAWAGYLLPRALRQSDGVVAEPVDADSSTMRVVHRTPAMMRALLAETEPVTPERKAADKVALKDSERERASAVARPAGAGAAVRRRRILLVLLAPLAATVATASLGTIAWAYVAIPGTLVAAWLVLGVLMARKERLARRTRVARPAPVAMVADEVAQEVVAPVVLAVAAPVVVAEADLDDALWDPVPITLPTYVGKATARRTVRTIDLTQAGVASSGHDAADTALARRARAIGGGTPEATPDAAEVQQRRAAGA